MSDFLTIASLPVPVNDGSLKENEPERGGSESRSYNGALLSTVRWEKRSWSFTTAHMEQSQGNAIKAAVAGNIIVALGGTGFSGIYARVMIGQGVIINARSSDSNHWVMQYDVTMKEA